VEHGLSALVLDEEWPFDRGVVKKVFQKLETGEQLWEQNSNEG
jgi:hypothetical protein